MLVFGDRSERADPGERLAAIGASLRDIAEMRGGIARHAAIAAALIDSGCILQGLADADFQLVGKDCSTPQTKGIGSFVLALARMLCRTACSRCS